MRVAVLIRKWSVRGGNERAAVELVREIERLGHEAIVVCQKVDPSAGPARIELAAGISFDPTLAMISFALSARRKVEVLRSRREIDVAIGFNHSIVEDVYRLGGGTHAALLVMAESTPGLRAGPLVDRAALLLERARFRDPGLRLIVSPSRRAKEEILRHYPIDPERIEVIWNGVDEKRFCPAPVSDAERAAQRRTWGVGEDEPIALFVGQDLHRKGFDLAVRAAKTIGIRLVYCGKAVRPQDLDQRAIIWAGETRAIESAYRAADVLLAPSRYDPFGGVVLEALASGLPAVATRRIGATERAYGTALEALFVEDPEDQQAIARALERALDPKERPKLLLAAADATRGASLEAWGEKMIAVLQRSRTLTES